MNSYSPVGMNQNQFQQLVAHQLTAESLGKSLSAKFDSLNNEVNSLKESLFAANSSDSSLSGVGQDASYANFFGDSSQSSTTNQGETLFSGIFDSLKSLFQNVEHFLGSSLTSSLAQGLLGPVGSVLSFIGSGKLEGVE